MRPLFARAVAEHEELMAESGATRYLHKNGWLKIDRGETSFFAEWICVAAVRTRESAASPAADATSVHKTPQANARNRRMRSPSFWMIAAECAGERSRSQ